MSILICVPMYNEGPAVENVLGEILKLLELSNDCHILIVNDGSIDKTNMRLSKINHNRLSIANHFDKKGIGDCLITGIKEGKGRNFTHLCFWPGNYRIKAMDVYKLINKCSKFKNAYFHGSRYSKLKSDTNTPIHREIIIKLLSRIATFVSGEKLTDITCGLRLFPMSLTNPKLERSLLKSNYAGEQLLTIEAIKQNQQIIEHSTSFNYEPCRAYSHMRAINVLEIVLPWAMYLLQRIVQRPKSRTHQTEGIASVS